MKSSNLKYMFNCENNYKSGIILSEIVNGTWCRFCKNKTESILLKFLLQMFHFKDIQKEFKIKDCINVTSLRFNFYTATFQINNELEMPYRKFEN